MIKLGKNIRDEFNFYAIYFIHHDAIEHVCGNVGNEIWKNIEQNIRYTIEDKIINEERLRLNATQTKQTTKYQTQTNIKRQILSQ